MKLIINKKNSKKYNHKSKLIELIKNSNKMILCTGWMDYKGLKKLMPSFEKALESNDPTIKIYSNKAHTDAQSIQLLEKVPAIEHIIIDNVESRYLHTKIYYFQFGEKFTAVIGSANITIGGLGRNEELSMEVFGDIDSKEHENIFQYLEHLESL